MLQLLLMIKILAAGIAMDVQEEPVPQYLYKAVSIENWDESQSDVRLSGNDQKFVHFARTDQLNRILTKYWGEASEYMILKVETAKLPGKLVYESNPGGAAKYYHLYDGSIPMDAVAETKHIIQCESSKYIHDDE